VSADRGEEVTVSKAWRGLSHRDELLRAFRIGPTDIEANRENRLGPGQIRRLRRNLWLNVLTVTPFQLALVAFIALGARIPGVGSEAARTRSLAASVFVYLIALLLLAGLVAMEVSWVRGIWRSLRAGVVRGLSGPVTVHVGSRGGTWLTVDGERNRLWTAYWHVGRGRNYRVYIVPAAKLIIAMEPDGWE
jgi:hypothetical protein